MYNLYKSLFNKIKKSCNDDPTFLAGLVGKFTAALLVAALLYLMSLDSERAYTQVPASVPETQTSNAINHGNSIDGD
jgi:hypothetical protein